MKEDSGVVASVRGRAGGRAGKGDRRGWVAADVEGGARGVKWMPGG